MLNGLCSPERGHIVCTATSGAPQVGGFSSQRHGATGTCKKYVITAHVAATAANECNYELKHLRKCDNIINIMATLEDEDDGDGEYSKEGNDKDDDSRLTTAKR